MGYLISKPLIVGILTLTMQVSSASILPKTVIATTVEAVPSLKITDEPKESAFVMAGLAGTGKSTTCGILTEKPDVFKAMHSTEPGSIDGGYKCAGVEPTCCDTEGISGGVEGRSVFDETINVLSALEKRSVNAIVIPIQAQNFRFTVPLRQLIKLISNTVTSDMNLILQLTKCTKDNCEDVTDEQKSDIKRNILQAQGVKDGGGKIQISFFPQFKIKNCEVVKPGGCIDKQGMRQAYREYASIHKSVPLYIHPDYKHIIKGKDGEAKMKEYRDKRCSDLIKAEIEMQVQLKELEDTKYCSLNVDKKCHRTKTVGTGRFNTRMHTEKLHVAGGCFLIFCGPGYYVDGNSYPVNTTEITEEKEYFEEHCQKIEHDACKVKQKIFEEGKMFDHVEALAAELEENAQGLAGCKKLLLNSSFDTQIDSAPAVVTKDEL